MNKRLLLPGLLDGVRSVPCVLVAVVFVAGLLGPLGTPAVAQPAAVSLELADAYGPVSTLQVGHTLSAQVTGLDPGQTVTLTVRDANEWPVVSVAALADASGEAEVAPLWQATGIVGCDCTSDPQTYVFRRAETALQSLVGQRFEVVVRDTSGSVLAATNLPLAWPITPVAFPADATGCPRYLLQDVESLHLLVLGGAAGAKTDATLAPANGPILEVRSNQPEGPMFYLNGSGFEVKLLWPGSQTQPGGYRLMVGGPGWPPLQNLGGSPVNSGLVVDDHSCPPTEEPPSEG